MHKINRLLRLNKKAVSPVISYVIVVLIVVSSISIVMAWGIPYMNQLNAEAFQENVFSQFNYVKNTLKNMVYEESGASQEFNLDLGDGMATIDEKGDRFIVSYSYDPNFDYNLTGLDDIDTKFSVYTSDTIDHIDVVWFQDPILHLQSVEDLTFIDIDSNYHNLLKFDICSIYNDKNIEDIELLSADLRFFPIDKDGMDAIDFGFYFSDIAEDFWDETWSSNRFINILKTIELESSNSDFGSDYFDIDIFDLINNKIQNNKKSVSICVSNKNKIHSPFIKINENSLKFGDKENSISVYSQNLKTDLKPEIVIHYIERENSVSIEPETINFDEKNENNKIKYSTNNCRCKLKLEKEKTEIENDNYDYLIDMPEQKAYFKEVSSMNSDYPIAILKNNCIIKSTPTCLAYCSSQNLENIITISEVKKSYLHTYDNIIMYESQFGNGFDLSYIYSNEILKEYLNIEKLDILPCPVDMDSSLIIEHKLKSYNLETSEPLGIVYGDEKICIRSYNSYTENILVTNEEVYFIDDQNNVLYLLPGEIYAWDNNGFEKSKVELFRTIKTESNGDVTIWIHTPCSWIFNSNREFPIVVDETIQYTYTTNDVNPDQIGNVIPKYSRVGKWHPQGTSTQPYPPYDAKYFDYNDELRDNISVQGDGNVNKWKTTSMSLNNFQNIWYSVPIDVSYDTISYIDFDLYVCYEYDWTENHDPDLYLYIWNYSSGEWETIASREHDNACDISSSSKISATIFNNPNEPSFRVLSNYLSDEGLTKPLQVAFATKISKGVNPLTLFEDYFEVTVTIDEDPPTISLINGPSEIELNIDDTISFTWEGNDDQPARYGARKLRGVTPDSNGLVYLYRLSGSYPSSLWSDWTSTTTITYDDLADGNYSFEIIAEDAAGNDATHRLDFNVAKGSTDFEENIIGPVRPYGYDFDITGVVPLAPDFEETIRIDLFNGPASTDIIGRIFIFDLGLIEYKKPTGTGSYDIVFENNGIIHKNPNIEYMREEPTFYSEDNILAFRINQLRLQDEGGFSSGSGNLKLKANFNENFVRELFRETVYKLKIQMWGTYEDYWLDYFENTHDFYPVVSSDIQNTVMHPRPEIQTILTLSQSELDIILTL